MYKCGAGVAKDYGKAVYWYEKAAEQGEITALDIFREVYETG
jgi:TPR repeat protein